MPSRQIQDDPLSGRSSGVRVDDDQILSRPTGSQVAPVGVTPPGGGVAYPSGMDEDTQRLHQLGYAQELRRGMGSFSNFAISFSIISILTGGITTYYLGMDAGGPLVITTGWFIVGAFVLCVGLGMAEICSAYPTAGGLYYWSAQLATKNKAAWSWTCGWFNLVGQVAVTASIDYGLATYVGFLITLYHANFHATAKWVLVFYAIILPAAHHPKLDAAQLVSLEHLENEPCLVVHLHRKPPRQQANVMPLQRVHFRIERRDMFRAVIISERFEAKFSQHRRPILRSALLPIKGHDAPRHQVAPPEQIITRPRLRLAGIQLRTQKTTGSSTKQHRTKDGPTHKTTGSNKHVDRKL